jgi:hypothetical protein
MMSRHRMRAGIRRSISMASDGPMTATSRPPIPMRDCTRRGAGARRATGYLGHVLMEHRSGLIVQTTVTLPTAMVSVTRRPG